jgi:hypothetical protein
VRQSRSFVSGNAGPSVSLIDAHSDRRTTAIALRGIFVLTTVGIFAGSFLASYQKRSSTIFGEDVINPGSRVNFVPALVIFALIIALSVITVFFQISSKTA